MLISTLSIAIFCTIVSSLATIGVVIIVIAIIIAIAIRNALAIIAWYWLRGKRPLPRDGHVLISEIDSDAFW